MNANKNNSSNKTEPPKMSPEIKFALTIFKFYIQLIEKFGIWGIDFVAARLSLSPPGKSLSQMSVNELAQHFRELGQKLLNPVVRAQIMEVIKNSQPIMQEAMTTMVNAAMSAGEFALSDGITFLCSDTPLAPLCGAFKLVGNAEKLGSEVLDDTGKAVDVAKKANQESKEVSNVLANPTIPSSLDKKAQIGGSKSNDIHSIINEKKKIKNRIHTSIAKFLYTKNRRKPNIKTKRKANI
jgi:hypothetical protein